MREKGGKDGDGDGEREEEEGRKNGKKLSGSFERPVEAGRTVPCGQ